MGRDAAATWEVDAEEVDDEEFDDGEQTTGKADPKEGEKKEKETERERAREIENRERGKGKAAQHNLTKTRPSGQRCVLKHFWAYPLKEL